MAGTGRLQVVVSRESPPLDLGEDGDVGDLALTATIFAVSFMPIVGAVAHLGQWSQGELGLGAGASLLAGRELWACACAALARRRS